MSRLLTPPAGARATRATFQKNSPTTADNGQRVESWSTIFSRWVQLSARGGRESFLFVQMMAEIDHVIHCDYDATLAAATPALWRILVGSRIFNVDAILDPDGCRRTLRIFATEVLP